MTWSVVTLGDANKGTATVDDNDPTRVGMTCCQGILSDALGTSAGDYMTEIGEGTTDDETPTTGTMEGGGAGGAMVENVV